MEAEPILGCQAHELEIGTEFSVNEGRTWYVVQTEPRYLSEAPECLTLVFTVAEFSPKGAIMVWEEMRLEDSDHVLLERTWSSASQPQTEVD